MPPLRVKPTPATTALLAAASVSDELPVLRIVTVLRTDTLVCWAPNASGLGVGVAMPLTGLPVPDSDTFCVAPAALLESSVNVRNVFGVVPAAVGLNATPSRHDELALRVAGNVVAHVGVVLVPTGATRWN